MSKHIMKNKTAIILSMLIGLISWIGIFVFALVDDYDSSVWSISNSDTIYVITSYAVLIMVGTFILAKLLYQASRKKKLLVIGLTIMLIAGWLIPPYPPLYMMVYKGVLVVIGIIGSRFIYKSNLKRKMLWTPLILIVVIGLFIQETMTFYVEQQFMKKRVKIETMDETEELREREWYPEINQLTQAFDSDGIASVLYKLKGNDYDIYHYENEVLPVLKQLMAHPAFKESVNHEFYLSGGHDLSPLIYTLMFSDQQLAKLLLEFDQIDINYQDSPYQATAFFYAVKIESDFYDEEVERRKRTIAGKVDVLKMIFARNDFDPNIQNRLGQTGLFYINPKYPEIVDEVLKYKTVDVNIQNNDGNTVLLHWLKTDLCSSFYEKYAEKFVTGILSREDLNLNLMNKEGYTAVGYAREKCQYQPKIIELLAQATPEDNIDDDDRELLDAAYQVRLKQVPFGDRFSHETEFPEAAELKRILENKSVNINVRDDQAGGQTALINVANAYNEYGSVSILQRYQKMVEVLLNADDIDPNIQNNAGNTALHIFMKIYRQQLRRSSPDLETLASLSNIVQMFLKHEKLVLTTKNKKGQTPIHQYQKHITDETIIDLIKARLKEV